MKNQAGIVLQIAEMGGDAQIQHWLLSLNLQHKLCTRMREALKILKHEPVVMVLADYHYQRNFSMQRSNLDSLFSQLASMTEPPQLVLLTLPEDRKHLDEVVANRLSALQPLVLEVPVHSGQFDTLKTRIMTCIS